MAQGARRSPTPWSTLLSPRVAGSYRWRCTGKESGRYVQSNFNSDNCLVGGSTLDYGPFGFMERYDPKWAMWVGSGEHYSFGNQVEAARRNWETLVRSLEPLLDDTTASRRAVDAARRAFADEARDAEAQMWAAKLGLCWPNAVSLPRSPLERLDRHHVFVGRDRHRVKAVGRRRRSPRRGRRLHVVLAPSGGREAVRRPCV